MRSNNPTAAMAHTPDMETTNHGQARLKAQKGCYPKRGKLLRQTRVERAVIPS